MKNKVKLLRVIALAVIVGFAMAGCKGPAGSDNQTPVADDYDISGNLTQTAGSVTAVTVTPKAGKSPGTVTVLYNGSETIPQTAGDYAVTFNVAEAEGWNAASGLSAGTLVCKDPDDPADPNSQTPVAADYDISGNLTQSAGSVTAVTVTAKEGKSPGTVTVLYNGSETIPQTIGNYPVTFNVAAATGWNAASGLSVGTLEVNDKATPTVTTWPTAATITYGAALSTSELTGGTAEVAGTFAWTHGATIPTVTNSGYDVTFTPTDTANYNPTNSIVSITVNQKALTVTGASHTKPYDTTTTANGVTVTLGGIVSDDDVSAGTVTAEYTATTAGTTTVNITGVTLTGTNADNYTVTMPANNITVAGITKANPIVTWPTAAAIIYGAALSTSALTGGSGAGSFAWTNGATIPTVTNSGYEVTFTPTDTVNYNTLKQNVAITVLNAVTVTNGTGGGNYVQGATVTITADMPPEGQKFTNWTTTSAGVTFANANSASTSFTMPGNAVTVTANFEPLAIGDTGPGGGIIFYYSAGGFTVEMVNSAENYTAHYLEVAPEITGTSIQWGAYGTEISGVTTFTSATNANIGKGRKDTALMHLATTTNTAAQICAALTTGGKTDWFLPSLGELNELYQRRTLTGINTTTGWYWSSSQYDYIAAWCQGFETDYQAQTTTAKINSNSVRAIRAF